MDTFDIDLTNYRNPNDPEAIAAQEKFLRERWDADFWSSYPILRDMDRFARARMVSPWSVLGGCLLRVACATSGRLVLPPIVGGKASLNLIVASVGGSGTGKTAGLAVSRDFITFEGEAESWPVGSGQGLAAAFLSPRGPRGQVVMARNDVHGILYIADEVETLTALGKVEGSTLMSVLRTAWSGDAMGAMNADPTRRRRVEAHDYRLGLMIGVQPEMSGPLFAQDGAGTPQRFLWLPAAYSGLVRPNASERAWAASWSALHWSPVLNYGSAVSEPVEGAEDFLAPEQWRDTFFTVCEQAIEEIETDRENRMAAEARGEDAGLDGHRLQARLKVAAALALLCTGRADVTENIWELSEMLDDLSVKTRSAAQTGSIEAAKKKGREAGIEFGARQAAAAVVAEDERFSRIETNILRWLANGPVTATKLNQKARGDDKRLMPGALISPYSQSLENLENDGRILRCTVSGDIAYCLPEHKEQAEAAWQPFTPEEAKANHEAILREMHDLL